MSARVVHFEIPFDDGDRARSFYGDVFDWSIQTMPELDYTIVSTGPADDQGMPSEPGYIGGGMMQRQESDRDARHHARRRRHRQDAGQHRGARRLDRGGQDGRRRDGLRGVLPGQRRQPDGAVAERLTG